MEVERKERMEVERKERMEVERKERMEVERKEDREVYLDRYVVLIWRPGIGLELKQSSRLDESIGYGRELFGERGEAGNKFGTGELSIFDVKGTVKLWDGISSDRGVELEDRNAEVASLMFLDLLKVANWKDNEEGVINRRFERVEKPKLLKTLKEEMDLWKGWSDRKERVKGSRYVELGYRRGYSVVYGRSRSIENSLEKANGMWSNLRVRGSRAKEKGSENYENVYIVDLERGLVIWENGS